MPVAEPLMSTMIGLLLRGRRPRVEALRLLGVAAAGRNDLALSRKASDTEMA